MAIQLPPLPFHFKDLEPHISERTLKVHYEKHHAGYVEKLNKQIRNTPYDKLMLEEIIFESVNNPADKKIFNNAAQTWNHTFYWNCLSSNKHQQPVGDLKKAIESYFDKLEKFEELFIKTAQDLFGSGWVWLVKDSSDNLSIMPLENAENPIVMGKTPLLVCDVWEHAYYLDYQNERESYLKGFKDLINWSFVEDNYNKSPVIFHTNQYETTTGLYH